jgi:serine protease inhibitor
MHQLAFPRYAELGEARLLELRYQGGPFALTFVLPKAREGIADPPSLEDRLFIDDVFHKAFLKLDEGGTEAVAATALDMVPLTEAIPRKKRPEFRADHPFLLLLRHVRTGLLLFVARVADPRS